LSATKELLWRVGINRDEEQFQSVGNLNAVNLTVTSRVRTRTRDGFYYLGASWFNAANEEEEHRRQTLLIVEQPFQRECVMMVRPCRRFPCMA
jgi:hypothetical protein